MSEGKSGTKTTRSDGLYNEALKSGVIDEIENQTRILDFTVSSFGWRAVISYYENTNNISELSSKTQKPHSIWLSTSDVQRNIDTVSKLTEITRKRDTEKKQWIQERDIKSFNIYPEIVASLVIELPDGSQKQKFVREVVDSPSHKLVCLYNAFQRDIEVTYIQDEREQVCVDGQELCLELSSNNTMDYEAGASKTGKQILEVLRGEGAFHTGRFLPLRNDDTNFYLDIDIGNETVTLSFDSSTEREVLWEIAGQFGVGDPMLLEGSDVRIGVFSFINSSSIIYDEPQSVYTDYVWLLRTPKSKTGVIGSLVQLFN